MFSVSKFLLLLSPHPIITPHHPNFFFYKISPVFHNTQLNIVYFHYTYQFFLKIFFLGARRLYNNPTDVRAWTNTMADAFVAVYENYLSILDQNYEALTLRGIRTIALPWRRQPTPTALLSWGRGIHHGASLMPQGLFSEPPGKPSSHGYGICLFAT